MKRLILLSLLVCLIKLSFSQQIDTIGGYTFYDSTDYDLAQFALTSCIGFVKVC